MKPTDEQAAIIRAATTTNDNLLITARAGAAKTTTLKMIAEAMPDTPAWCLAFNRAIAAEMAKELPPHCASGTFNSLGNHTWFRYLGLDRRSHARFKVNDIVRETVGKLIGKDREELTPTISDEIVRAVKFGKSMGFLPTQFRGDYEPLCTEDEFFDTLDFAPTPLQKELICEVSGESFQQALAGKIDFDDQLLCPAICPVDFEQKPVVLVDEAQDLSPVQHQMLQSIVGDGRIIAVGDPFQAIYEFRGAMSDSMDRMKKRFDMSEHSLTISFRCDKAIVRNIHWHAPDLRWADGAAEGQVNTLESWNHENVPDDAAILCRNNAPLFSIFIKLLQAGRHTELVNRVFVNDLIKIMENWQPRNMPRQEVIQQVEKWLSDKSERSSNTDFPEDQAECMRLFANQADNLAGTIEFANNLSRQKGRIKLSTIHRSKGLEFDSVFILDRGLLSATGQDPNLRYVAETRAKHNLTYLTSEGYHANSADPAGQISILPRPTNTPLESAAPQSPVESTESVGTGSRRSEATRTPPRRRRRARTRPAAASSSPRNAPEAPSNIQTSSAARRFRLDDRVRHPDFGEGVIRNVRKQRTVIDVVFDVGQRLRSVPAEQLQPISQLLPGAKPAPNQDAISGDGALPITPNTAPAAVASPQSTLPNSLLKVGDKVRHQGFGVGVIQSLNKSRCRVLFENGLPPCEVPRSDLRPTQ